MAVELRDPPCFRIREEELCYSRKGLPVVEKMKKQLAKALWDPARLMSRGGFNASSDSGWVASFCCKKKKADIPLESFHSGVAQTQGAREYQEDRYLNRAEVNRNEWLFGVFDGHGDSGEVGNYLSENLARLVRESMSEVVDKGVTDKDQIVADGFVRAFHQATKTLNRTNAGATAACAFVSEDKMYFPNVGDSRIILVKKNGQTYQLTEDAKPYHNQFDPTDKTNRFLKWHEKMGNLFWNDAIVAQKISSIWSSQLPYKDELERCRKEDIPDRVGSENGSKFVLNVFRDVGNNWMCCRPKITRILIGQGNDDLRTGTIYASKGDYIVIASDGLWDCGTTEEVGDSVRTMVDEKASPEKMAEKLVEEAAQYQGVDNVTAMVVAI